MSNKDIVTTVLLSRLGHPQRLATRGVLPCDNNGPDAFATVAGLFREIAVWESCSQDLVRRARFSSNGRRSIQCAYESVTCSRKQPGRTRMDSTKYDKIARLWTTSF